MLIMPPFSLTNLELAGEHTTRVAQLLDFISIHEVEALDQPIGNRVALQNSPGIGRSDPSPQPELPSPVRAARLPSWLTKAGARLPLLRRQDHRLRGKD